MSASIRQGPLRVGPPTITRVSPEEVVFSVEARGARVALRHSAMTQRHHPSKNQTVRRLERTKHYLHTVSHRNDAAFTRQLDRGRRFTFLYYFVKDVARFPTQRRTIHCETRCRVRWVSICAYSKIGENWATRSASPCAKPQILSGGKRYILMAPCRQKVPFNRAVSREHW